MNVARTSHSSFVGGDTLVVLCGFSFERGALNSVEMLNLKELENSRGHQVYWTNYDFPSVKACWSPIVCARVRLGDPTTALEQYLVLVGGQNQTEYLDDV